MEHAAAAYEPFHFHLLYDAVLSIAGFLVVLAICRVLSLHDPKLRIRIFALVIGLPILGELVAMASYMVRPAPHTPIGQAILRFHEQCGFCSLFDKPSFLGTKPWLILSALLVITLVSLIKKGLGALILRRLAVKYSLFPISSHPGLHQHLVTVAARCKAPLPRIAITPHLEPVALTCGVRHPTIIISQGMLRQFSQAELEAVLTHELAHVVRRDNLWNWLIALLRDTLFFFPTSHLAWRQIVIFQEKACDDLTIRWTGRPLDLARSLVKFCQHSPIRHMVCSEGLFLTNRFLRRESFVERRIERIILSRRREAAIPSSKRIALVIGAIVLILMLFALPIVIGC